MQAKYGNGKKLAFMAMSRAIRPQHLASLQAALADNVRVLMDNLFLTESRSIDRRIELLERLSEVSRNTIYRILDPEKEANQGIYRYPRLDSIAKLARAFSVSTPQILTPDFGTQYVASKAGKKRLPGRAA